MSISYTNISAMNFQYPEIDVASFENIAMMTANPLEIVVDPSYCHRVVLADIDVSANIFKKLFFNTTFTRCSVGLMTIVLVCCPHRTRWRMRTILWMMPHTPSCNTTQIWRDTSVCCPLPAESILPITRLLCRMRFWIILCLTYRRHIPKFLNYSTLVLLLILTKKWLDLRR